MSKQKLIIRNWIASVGYFVKGEMVNQISEYSKLAQKEYKTWHDWVWKSIKWELFNRWKFKHFDKWYLHKLESVPGNKTHKILWNFEI